jgi:hypothetical protein
MAFDFSPLHKRFILDFNRTQARPHNAVFLSSLRFESSQQYNSMRLYVAAGWILAIAIRAALMQSSAARF